jgi:hypothetical protein
MQELMNKSLKNHLKQLYSKRILEEDNVPAPAKIIKKTSLDMLCHWFNTMAMNLSRSECCIYDEMDERENKEQLGMLEMNMREKTEMVNTVRMVKLNKDW